jgi:predicted kinase
MPRATILVGVPGSGKTTWIKENYDPEVDVIISIDDTLEAIAKEKGLTYNEVFKDFVDHASHCANSLAVNTVAEGKKNIIWDMTNTTVKSRKRKLNLLNKKYDVRIAVVFPTPDRAELERRLKARPGKHISQQVLNDMLNRLELPTFDEGFTFIQTVDNSAKVAENSDNIDKIVENVA